MKEEPQVRAVADGSVRRQWGRDLFFFLDGKKRTVDVVRLRWVVGVLVVSFGSVQLADIDTEQSQRTVSEFALPTSLPPGKLVEFPKTQPEDPHAKQSKSGRLNKRATPVRFTGPQLIERPRDLQRIPPGTLIKAVLINGASNGPVKAEAKEAVRVNGDILIEPGSILLGTGSSTEERLLVTFQQVIFRDGSVGTIQAVACDESDRIVGLKGSKVGNRALNIAGSIGLGFVGGLSEGLQDTQGQQGVTIRPPTLRNAMLHATATTALEQSRNLMSELKNRQPIIEIGSGENLYVLFSVAP